MCWLRMYEQYLDQYDWFMKADDDSFVMVENLRRFLAKYDPNVPHFFGASLVVRSARDIVTLPLLDCSFGRHRVVYL